MLQRQHPRQGRRKHRRSEAGAALSDSDAWGAAGAVHEAVSRQGQEGGPAAWSGGSGRRRGSSLGGSSSGEAEFDPRPPRLQDAAGFRLPEAYQELLREWCETAYIGGDLVVCPVCFEWLFDEQCPERGSLPSWDKAREESPCEVLVSGSRGAERAARAVAPTIAGMKRHLREAHGISAAALTARAGAQALLKRYKLRAADGMVDRYLAGPGGGAAFGASKNSYWLADGAYHRAIYNEVRFYVENRDRTAGAGAAAGSAGPSSPSRASAGPKHSTRVRFGTRRTTA